VRLDKTSHGYHFPAERLSFSAASTKTITAAAKTIKEATVRPAVVNISSGGTHAARGAHNIVKVRSSASSASSYAHYQRHSFRI
jgi:hypothetical protein